MGGNLWRKWLGESDEPGRNRVQAFVYSRLWMGVFPSFLAGFAVMRGGLCDRGLGCRSSR